ncbi:MurR/RpiR family transcriptional regulator [Agromyces bauzanensis]
MPVQEAPAAEPGQRAVLVRIRAMLPELRPSEQRIASLLIAEPSVIAELSIAELAARCDTSTTSVVRFCKRIGYEHLKDLRMDVLREITRETFETAGLPEVSGDIDRDDRLEDIVAKVSMAETLSIADTAKVLDIAALQAAVDTVGAAHRVDIFGVGASSFVGLDLQQKLTRIGRTALNWSDPHAAWTSAATLGEGAVAIAVSHSGGTVDTIEFLAIARAAGATTIAITNHDSSPLTEHADIVLTTAARETGFRSGALGSRIAQLMVVDCVFIGVAQASYDQSMAAIRNTYAAVHHLRSRR